MKLLALLLPFLMATAALAEDGKSEGLLNKLLAPGPLIQDHKELEHSRCLECHTPSEGIPDTNCLVCHKELKPQIEKKTGFHGLTGKKCIDCHNDHKGREFDSTVIDPKSFDHTLTGYNLEGKHATIDCAKCHLEKRAKAKKSVRPKDLHYLGAKTSCIACHRKEDPHQFKGEWAKKDCTACHSLKSWKDSLKFDHFKETKFKLEGAHAKAKCATCHAPKNKPVVYQWKTLAKDRCLSCHTNTHGENLSAKYQGGDCSKCHTQASWKIEKFDHASAGYPLKGKHAEIRCQDCHKQEPQALKAGKKSFDWTGLRKDCLSCHKDIHLFAGYSSKTLPKSSQCTTCHNEKSWKDTSFDHDRDTRYRIGGKHEGLACSKCHTPVGPKAPPVKRQYSWPALTTKTCENCHATPHKKTFSPAMQAKACTECHVDSGWNISLKDKSFDHQKTRFELTGKHKEVSCKDCHGTGKNQVFHFVAKAAKFCVDCHKNIHTGQFSKSFAERGCAECHTTTDWKRRLNFDHSVTRFKLDGKHSPLDCGKCHTPTREMLPLKVPRPKAQFVFTSPPDTATRNFCDACHTNVHKDQFHPLTAARSCDSCHSTQDFTKRSEFNHSETTFPLHDKHATTKCEKCHLPGTLAFPPPSKTRKSQFVFAELGPKGCTACHKDPHTGSFGKKCADCHNERNWKSVKDFHKNFSLSGVHFSVECTECHRTGRRLAGMSGNCALCHQKDDIHNGTLPDCGSCHLQYFWESSKFRHSLTNFALRGIHRTLDCYSCHNTGMYKGISGQCISCHLRDAQAVTSPVHTGSYLSQSCSVCHNQFSFR